ncbi:BlaI/MecI/CopY family transcriptional regulator [Rothia sp. ARF10]|nr:BlaI/MecI/CopY family transcriptional regulator [Rothia sp. ARF10]
MPPTSPAPRLGDLERSVMEQLWDSAATRPDGSSVREVLEGLPGERDLAYTTVMTVLDRLSKKGLVTRERDGRAWRYTPAGTRESLTAETMRASLGDVTDRRAALLHFLDGATSEELDDLRAALSEVEQRRG